MKLGAQKLGGAILSNPDTCSGVGFRVIECFMPLDAAQPPYIEYTLNSYMMLKQDPTVVGYMALAKAKSSGWYFFCFLVLFSLILGVSRSVM